MLYEVITRLVAHGEELVEGEILADDDPGFYPHSYNFV